MNVFGIGLPEMVLILVVALLIFGPKKLPEIGRSLGKALKGFQDASKEFESEFKRQAEMLENDKPLEARLETPEPEPYRQLNQSEPEADQSIDVATSDATTSEPATSNGEAAS